MDYEKKQRLLGLREKMKSYGYMDGVEELDSIFPELTESEDEKIRRWLIHDVQVAIDDGIYNDESIQDARKAIAWLEKQKEQKPEEWSEEDKEMKLKILKYLSTRCSVLEFEEVENWLNNLSIQPHWKPSEEQMDALKLIVSNKKRYAPVLHEIALDTLYNDLKQL